MSFEDGLSAKVIGQIAMMQGVVAQLPDEVSVLGFVAKGLSDIPGVKKVEYVLFNNEETSVLEYETEELRHIFPIEYKQSKYSSLIFHLSDRSKFDLYAPYIGNFTNVLAVLFEERRQRKSNEALLENLEELVDERTKELKQEIAERKNAEAELERTKDYISNVIESMPSALISVNENLEVTQWNLKAEEITGVPAPDAFGMKLDDVFPRMKKELELISNSIQNKEIKFEQKTAYEAESGVGYEDITIYPLVAIGIQGAVLRIDDVTSKVRMEEMLVQSEKMLSIGGLAAGMAHEINNPLAGMMQTANVMQNRLVDNVDIPANRRAAEEIGVDLEAIVGFMSARGIPRMIHAIKESGVRVASIVNNMLHFAQQSDDEINTSKIADIIENTISLVSTDYNLKKQYDFKKINIIREFQEDLPEIECHSSKIQQAMLNLFSNSAHALQQAKVENPKIIIRLAIDEKQDGKDAMVRVEIEDNGPGISSKVIGRLFEPFYTTKPTGEGKGLGLSVAYFIITESHKGKMWVESNEGVGTKFIICLPVKQNGSDISIDKNVDKKSINSMDNKG